MKKFKFISAIALLSMAMVSCDGYDLPDPKGEGYPEVPAFNADGLSLAQGETTVDLISANNENKNIKVATITELKDFPETYNLVLEMQVAKDNGFTNYATIATTVNGSDVTVRPDQYNAAVAQAITKDPAKVDAYVRFAAFAQEGATKIRIGGPDKFYSDYKATVTPFEPGKIIEDSYYLVGDFCGWDLSRAIPFTNTVAGASPYDNPEFAVKVDISAAEAANGYTWKVVPASSKAANSWVGALGSKPAMRDITDKEGNVLGQEEDPNNGTLFVSAEPRTDAGVIKTAGPILISINIEADTYRIGMAFDALYPLSGSTVQNPASAMLLYTDNYINYTGVAALKGVWYIAGQPAISGPGAILYKGDGDPVDTKAEDGTITSRSGKITVDGGKTLRAPISGLTLYWADINFVQSKYTISPITSMSVVGEHNGWNEKEAPALTPSADLKKWTGTMQLGGAFKINCNHAWDLDFGGTSIPDVMAGQHQYNLTFKGGNLNVDETATYDVTVDFGVYPYVLTLVKK